MKLTQEEISKLKEKYPDRPLYCKTIAGQDYVFTYINRPEFLEIQEWLANNEKIPAHEIDDKVMSVALLYPELDERLLSVLPAGLAPTLSQAIQEKSYIDMSTGYMDLDVDVIREPEEKEKPDKDVIESVKKKVTHPLRLVRACNNWFIIRPLLRIEFMAMQKKIEDKSIDAEKESVDKCVVWSTVEDYDKEVAGIVPVVSRQILIFSGFSDVGVEVTEL